MAIAVAPACRIRSRPGTRMAFVRIASAVKAVCLTENLAPSTVTFLAATPQYSGLELSQPGNNSISATGAQNLA